MRYLNEKKAVSAIMVTILILLVAIGAVAIFWTTFRGQLEAGTEQIEARQQCMNLALDLEKATYDSGSGNLSVRIARDSVPGAEEVNMTGLRIAVAVGDDQESEEFAALDILETKTYVIEGLTGEPGSVKIAGVLDGSIVCTATEYESIEVK